MLNKVHVSNEILQQAKNWLNSEKTTSRVIPRELRLWVHSKCSCTCQVCGSLVDDSRIGITKFCNSSSSHENLALICRSCRSRMRSYKTIDEFRQKQKILLLRDIEKLQNSLEFYYTKKCNAIPELKEFLRINNIEFPNERN